MFLVSICIGYHMNGEVILVVSLEGRYCNCHERAQGARDNYDIVTRVIQLISPRQSCDNFFITTCALIRLQIGKTLERVQNAFFIRLLQIGTVYQQQVFLVVLPFLFSSKRFKPNKLNTVFKSCVRHLKCFERDKKRYQGQKTISGTKNDFRVTYSFYVLLLST